MRRPEVPQYEDLTAARSTTGWLLCATLAGQKKARLPALCKLSRDESRNSDGVAHPDSRAGPAGPAGAVRSPARIDGLPRRARRAFPSGLAKRGGRDSFRFPAARHSDSTMGGPMPAFFTQLGQIRYSASRRGGLALRNATVTSGRRASSRTVNARGVPRSMPEIRHLKEGRRREAPATPPVLSRQIA